MYTRGTGSGRAAGIGNSIINQGTFEMIEYYILIGSNVENSPMDDMMNEAFSVCGIQARYIKHSTSNFDEVLNMIRNPLISGYNITMPFKTYVLKYVNPVDDAKISGSVNTVIRKENTLVGYNTDVSGILYSLREAGINSLRNSCAVGSGGATRAFILAARKLGCNDVIILSRKKENASSSLKNIDYVNLRIMSYEEMNEDVDIIFNGSPAGSKNVETPKQLFNILGNTRIFFDAVYYPVETELITEAKKKGLKVIYGYRMLLFQAAKAFSLFTGMEPPMDEMDRKLKERLNISLC
jgi:shikimate dehydrogenase